jgi:hypothetical protein
MDQSMMEEIMEFLKANQNKMEAEKKPDKVESMVRREADKAEEAEMMTTIVVLLLFIVEEIKFIMLKKYM